MKKIILMSVLAAGWITATIAQDNPASQTTTTTTTTTTSGTEQPSSTSAAPGASGTSADKVYFGLEFLPTFSHFDISQPEGGVYKTSFALGYGGGAFVGVNFTDHFALQAELLYSALAQKYTDPSNIERRIDLSYINVPLLMVFNTNITKPVNFNLAVGPQIGLNVGSKIDAEGTAVGDSVAAVLAVKTGDLGVAYGAGVDFGMGSVKLSIGYRGVLGLVDISDNSQTMETNEFLILDKSHISTYAAYVALRF